MVGRLDPLSETSPGSPQPKGEILRQYIRNGAGIVLARLHSDRADYFHPVCDLALQLIHYSLFAQEGWPLCRQMILGIAPRMEQLGYRSEWIHLLEEAVVWAGAEQDTGAEAEICRRLGQMYRLLDRYETAERWLLQAVAAFRFIGDARDVAIALNQLGRVYHLQHRYADALVCAAEALLCLGLEDSERAESHYVLGMVALNQWRWAEAEEQHKMALDFRLRSGDQRTIAWAYQNLGLLYLRQSEYGGQNRLAEAVEWLRQALHQLESQSDPYHLAVVLNNLGAVQERLGNYQEAIRFYQRASSLMRPLGGQRILAQIYNNLGLIYLHLAEAERAEDSFRDGVAIYMSIGDHQSRLNTQHGVVLALFQQKRFDEAAELCERSLAEIAWLQSVPEEYEEKRKWYTESLQKTRQGIG